MAYEQKTYNESDYVKKWREQMESHGGLKPAGYTSKWQDQLNTTMDSILNRKPFQYDVNADALYNQYKDRYVDLGQKAMADTMGQAAKLTGGYGNSNAQIVGQQAYQSYLQGLTDKIPELYNMAYNRYNQQGQDLYNQYNLLNNQEQMDYGRWNDLYSKWLTERDYLANQYNTERGYDYGVHRDAVSDAQWQAQFDEDLRRFNFQNKLGEFAVAPIVGGGGGDYSDGGGSSRSPAAKSAGYTDALYLVENAATTASQESVIQNAYDKGYITKSEAQSLAGKVGNTKYTKK